MTAKGHAECDAWQAMKGKAFTGPEVSLEEAAGASADVASKGETNAGGVWYAVGACQKKILAAAGRAFGEIAEAGSNQLAAAEGVLDGLSGRGRTRGGTVRCALIIC
ncbi:hypothetical protein ACIBBB_32895 [Streptomyces sp. NPDC051217]|uniref:hypothetical protein n=1 Tax=Streptomyces sp. NPDC051217 TaxID=3365644 RepID=UPI003792C8B0